MYRRSFLQSAVLAGGFKPNDLPTAALNSSSEARGALSSDSAIAIPTFTGARDLSGLAVGTLAVRTYGYFSEGDDGAALYVRSTSEPVHSGKVQIAGVWFELRERVVTPMMFGGTDDVAIQAAINYQSFRGGGVVQLYGKNHDVRNQIRVKEGVDLIGNIFRHPRSTYPGDSVQLNVFFGKGQTTEAAIIVERNTSVVGITGFWPDQVDVDMKDPLTGVVQAAPFQYGPFISSVGGEYATNLATVSKIMLQNAYIGIRWIGCGQCDLSEIHGQPILQGAIFDQVRDVDRYSSFHFWPFNAGRNAPPRVRPTALYDWIQNNGSAFIIGNVDIVSFFRFFAFGYSYGYRFTTFGNGGASATLIDCNCDTCIHPVHFDLGGAGQSVRFIGCDLIGVNIFGTTRSTVTTAVGPVCETDSGSVSFDGCSFSNNMHGLVCGSSTGTWSVNNSNPKGGASQFASDPNGANGILVINLQKGARVFSSNNMAWGKSINGISGAENTWVDGIPLPERSTDVTSFCPGLTDGSGWQGTTAAVKSSKNGFQINLLSGPLAQVSYQLPADLKHEIGPFVLSFDIGSTAIARVTAKGNSPQFSLRLCSGNDSVHADYFSRQQPRWAERVSLNFPALLPPFEGPVYLQFLWGNLGGQALVIAIENFRIFRADRNKIDTRLFGMMHNSRLWHANSGQIGMPIEIVGGKKRTFQEAPPTSGLHVVGDIIENSAPAAKKPIGWRYTTAGWLSIGTLGSP